eukprot:2106034-Amphidinium_carterae.1
MAEKGTLPQEQTAKIYKRNTTAQAQGNKIMSLRYFAETWWICVASYPNRAHALVLTLIPNEGAFETYGKWVEQKAKEERPNENSSMLFEQ